MTIKARDDDQKHGMKIKSRIAERFPMSGEQRTVIMQDRAD